MKRIVGITVALIVALAFIGCATTGAATATATTTAAPIQAKERRVGGSVPQFVKDALKKAPEDALVGIGTAKMGTLSLSRTAATTRARAEISRQMNTMIQDMVRDYTASSEVDPSAVLSFTENMTVALSKSTLTGSVPVDEDTDEAGNYWVVVYLGKSNVVQEINQAQAAAKLAAPAMASFNAEDRMNAAFDKAYGSEVGVGDR